MQNDLNLSFVKEFRWISGLGDDEGTAHPTLGGLRIAKKLRERLPEEPYDDRLEWDRDGQYFTTSPSGCSSEAA
jgi:hypothetical protein